MHAEGAEEGAMQLSVMQVYFDLQMVHFIEDIVKYNLWEYQGSKSLKLKNKLLIMHNRSLTKPQIPFCTASSSGPTMVGPWKIVQYKSQDAWKTLFLESYIPSYIKQAKLTRRKNTTEQFLKIPKIDPKVFSKE